jgi:nicotinamidase-related amidase
MNDTALLVIDMQQGLFNKKIYNSQRLIDNINHLLDRFHLVNSPVFLFRHSNERFFNIRVRGLANSFNAAASGIGYHYRQDPRQYF